MFTRRKIVVTCFLLICKVGFTSPATSSLETNYIPREILFGNPEKTAPLLSPDGNSLAYLSPNENNVLNICVLNFKNQQKEETITQSKKRGIPTFFWQYDNQHILYLQDQGGDENWHLYQTDVHTKETKDLTPFEGVRAEVIAYRPEFPNELLVALNTRDRSWFDVYQLNLQNGILKLEIVNTDKVVTWMADHHLQVRGRLLLNDEGENIVQVQESKNSSWKTLFQCGIETRGELIAFSSDNESLYVLEDLQSNTQRLSKIHIQTGIWSTLAENAMYDLSPEFLINPISNELEAIGIIKEHFEWIVLDPKVEADLHFLDKQGKEFKVLSKDLKNQKWIVVYASDQHPNRFFLYDRTTKKIRFLFSENSEVEKYSLSKMKPISFEARDGMKLHGYLTLPEGISPRDLPAVLLVHGGPWLRDSWGYKPTVQWLANRGYAVLQINYRGSSGYGKKYLDAGNKEWGGKMQTDLLDGKNWMVHKGYANKENVAIFGVSYGGYAALVGAAFTPIEFACAVDVVGPSNLVSLLDTIPPYWTNFRMKSKIRIGDPNTERAFLESRSPLFKVDQICRPLFIAQGANDPRVKQSESDQMVSALRKNGKEVEYILFSDEGHGLKRPENKLKFYEVAEEFFDKHLKLSRQTPDP